MIRGTSALAILQDIGLGRGIITLGIDTRDNRCDAGGATLTDLSGNGRNFVRGDGATAATYPAFSGTANQRNASRTFDGGDYLTKSTANDATINAIHKANGAASVICGWRHAATIGALCGDNGTSTTGGTGFNIFVGGTETIGLRVRNAGAGVLTYTSTAPVTENAWNFVGIAWDAASGDGRAQINGTAESFSASYASPAAGDASQTFQIGALGNAVNPLASGSELAYFFLFNRRLTAAELLRARNAFRRPLGI
jgi:hypothetical protein